MRVEARPSRIEPEKPKIRYANPAACPLYSDLIKLNINYGLLVDSIKEALLLTPHA